MGDRFNAGYRVKHKSGGPQMTVVSYDNYAGGRKCRCRWYDKKKEEFQMETFFDHELDGDE